MKTLMAWGCVFVVAMVFALLVDIDKPEFLPLLARQVLTALNLTLFLYLLARFVGRPMASFLETRRASIGQQLEDAKRKLEDAEKLRLEVVTRLERVEDEVRELRDKAETDGAREADAITEQARAEEERFLRRVEEEIGRRQEETRSNLARETAELTAQLTREVLSKELSEADRRKIFDRSLSALNKIEETS